MKKPTVLILGGSDKKVSFDPLARSIAEAPLIEHCVLIGDTANQIKEALDRVGYTAYTMTATTLISAWRRAESWRKRGATCCFPRHARALICSPIMRTEAKSSRKRSWRCNKLPDRLQKMRETAEACSRKGASHARTRVQRTCDKTVVVLMVLLLLMGLVTLFSATYYQKAATGDALAAVKKQLIGVALGAAACVTLSRVPYRVFRRPKVTLLLLATSALLLILVIIPAWA